MNEKNTDRRVRRTKKLLLQGLTQLLSEKKINKITVKELTESVDVNRATFYLYYKDIFDMMEQIENEMFEYFTEALKKYTNDGINKVNTVAFVTYLFGYIKEYADMCKILLGPDGDYSFVEKLKIAIKNTLPPLDNANNNMKEEYLMPFIVSGCIGAIQQWLGNNMNSEPEQMANFVAEMISNSCGM